MRRQQRLQWQADLAAQIAEKERKKQMEKDAAREEDRREEERLRTERGELQKEYETEMGSGETPQQFASRESPTRGDGGPPSSHLPAQRADMDREREKQDSYQHGMRHRGGGGGGVSEATPEAFSSPTADDYDRKPHLKTSEHIEPSPMHQGSPVPGGGKRVEADAGLNQIASSFKMGSNGEAIPLEADIKQAAQAKHDTWKQEVAEQIAAKKRQKEAEEAKIREQDRLDEERVEREREELQEAFAKEKRTKEEQRESIQREQEEQVRAKAREKADHAAKEAEADRKDEERLQRQLHGSPPKAASGKGGGVQNSPPPGQGVSKSPRPTGMGSPVHRHHQEEEEDEPEESIFGLMANKASLSGPHGGGKHHAGSPPPSPLKQSMTKPVLVKRHGGHGGVHQAQVHLDAQATGSPQGSAREIELSAIRRELSEHKRMLEEEVKARQSMESLIMEQRRTGGSRGQEEEHPHRGEERGGEASSLGGGKKDKSRDASRGKPRPPAGRKAATSRASTKSGGGSKPISSVQERQEAAKLRRAAAEKNAERDKVERKQKQLAKRESFDEEARERHLRKMAHAKKKEKEGETDAPNCRRGEDEYGGEYSEEDREEGLRDLQSPYRHHNPHQHHGGTSGSGGSGEFAVHHEDSFAAGGGESPESPYDIRIGATNQPHVLIPDHAAATVGARRGGSPSKASRRPPGIPARSAAMEAAEENAGPMLSPPVGGGSRAARKLLGATGDHLAQAVGKPGVAGSQGGAWLRDLGSRIVSLPPSQGDPGAMTDRSIECTAEEWRLMAAPMSGDGEVLCSPPPPNVPPTPLEERSMVENGSLLLYPGGHPQHQVSHEAAWAAAIRLPDTP